MVVHRRGWRVGVAVGVVVVGLVGVATAWATLFTPQPVVTAKGLQIRPSAALGALILRIRSRGRVILNSMTCT
jgi:hypothetical protein